MKLRNRGRLRTEVLDEPLSPLRGFVAELILYPGLASGATCRRPCGAEDENS